MPSAQAPPGLPRWGGRYAARLTAATLASWGRTCHLCGGAGATTADHLIPRSKGGGDDLDNLRPAHSSCNSARGDRWLWEWFAAHPMPARPAPTPSRDW